MIFGRSPRKPIGTKNKEALFALQNGRCMYCGRKMGLAYLHVDHKTPVSRGGTNRLSNLHLLCSACNTRKGNMSDGEFRRKYELAPAREAKGPPSKVIPQDYFKKKTKENKPKQRRSSGWLL